MTEQEYRSAAGVNKSTLWNMRKSPAHYKYYLDHAQEDTAAMKIGRAFHAAVLTPTAYKREYAVLPEGIDRRTKAGKEQYEEFISSAEGKEIITAQDAETIKQIAKAIRSNKDAAGLLKGTKREKPFFWTDDNGILCKCRMDAVTTGRIIDIKTAQDADTDVFVRESMKYGYHVQAAHYIDAYYKKIGSKTPEWYFIVVEKTEPYCVNILKADIGFLDYGFVVRQELMNKLIKCQKENSFPGYGLNELCLPGWVEV